MYFFSVVYFLDCFGEQFSERRNLFNYRNGKR